MTFEIVIPAQIVIPDDQVLELASAAKKRFGLEESDPINASDIVAQAFIDGVVLEEAFYEGWEISPTENHDLTNEELEAEIAPKTRKGKRKSKKQ